MFKSVPSGLWCCLSAIRSIISYFSLYVLQTLNRFSFYSVFLSIPGSLNVKTRKPKNERPFLFAKAKPSTLGRWFAVLLELRRRQWFLLDSLKADKLHFFRFFLSKFEVIHATNFDFDSGFWCKYDHWVGSGLESGALFNDRWLCLYLSPVSKSLFGSIDCLIFCLQSI